MKRSFVLPLSVAAALALASGCTSTNACKDGTLLVAVNFDSSSGAADALVVNVTADGDAPRTSTLAHSPGMIDGSVEIDFPTYTAGKNVQVTFTATKGGVTVGTGTGSVALASGCSTLSVKVGSSDGGVDSGTGAGGGTGTGGRGGSDASGAGGSATGGSGAGGSPIDAPVDMPKDMGCVFQSAEDCFNGIDDDCNGLTDCQDPACNPTAECVPAAGAFQPGIEANPTDTCPPHFTGGETAMNSGLSVPTGGCTGCSCNAKTTCSIGVYSYASVNACNADTSLTGGTLVGQLFSDTVTCQADSTGALNAPAFRIGNFTKTDSACTPSGTGAVPATTWNMQKKFCAANAVGAGCSPGYVCAPKRPALSDHCVRGDGSLTCPAGYTAVGSGWFKGVTDTRACGACTCGTQTPGACNASLNFWPANNMCPTNYFTNTSINRAPGTKSCCALACAAASCPATGGVACGDWGFTSPPQQASCPPSSAISGTATGSEPETLCCDL
jgi:hypothetical protein